MELHLFNACTYCHTFGMGTRIYTLHVNILQNWRGGGGNKMWEEICNA